MIVRAAELLEQAARVVEGTTPEPWMYVDGAIEGPNFTEVIAVEDLPRHAYPELQSGTLVLTEADGAFIAAARSLVPALAARLRDALTVIEAADIAMQRSAFNVDTGEFQVPNDAALELRKRIAVLDAGPAAAEEAKTDAG